MRDTTVEIATSIRSTAGASALFAAANAYHDSPPIHILARGKNH